MFRVIVISFWYLLPIPIIFAIFLKIVSRGSKKEMVEKYSIPFPTVIAHRGASYAAPEETRPAFRLAIDMLADYLEMDLQRTKDGVLIAFHDDTLERTTNISEIFPSRANQPVAEFTYQELLQLDAGSWFNLKYPKRKNDLYKGLKILTFEEVIDIAEGGKIGLMIETKNPIQFFLYEKTIVEILKKRGWLEKRGRVIFQSFSPESLKVFKELAPDIPRILLIEDFPKRKWKEVLEEARELAHGIGPAAYLCLPWNVNLAHKMGLFVYPYTVNKKWQMWIFNQFGVDGLITDRSDVAQDVFDA